MGIYDIVEVGGRTGQVKCWGARMRTIHWGDRVPRLHGFETYSIAMREGGYLHIQWCGLTGWESEPIDKGAFRPPVFDKYGRVFSEETKGELDGVSTGEIKITDPYLFR